MSEGAKSLDEIIWCIVFTHPKIISSLILSYGTINNIIIYFSLLNTKKIK